MSAVLEYLPQILLGCVLGVLIDAFLNRRKSP